MILSVSASREGWLSSSSGCLNKTMLLRRDEKAELKPHSLAQLMPETEVCPCGTVKELGNAASLSMNVPVDLLEATGKSVRPKRKRGL